MIAARHCNNLFEECIEHYHVLDTVDQPFETPVQENEIEQLLYDQLELLENATQRPKVVGIGGHVPSPCGCCDDEGA